MSTRERIQALLTAARWWGRRLLRAVIFITGGAVVVPPLQVLSVRWIDPPVTWTMLDTAWTAARADGRWEIPAHRVLSLQDYGETISGMVIVSEDQTFYLHHGFDDRQICAAVATWRAGGELRGASTITQQVARNVFLWQGGGFTRKSIEAVYTLWIEVLLPKDRILALYLSVAQTGPRAFGAESGAQHWFEKPARKLTWDQAARLASILPSPAKRDPRDRTSGVRAARLIRTRPIRPGTQGWEGAVEAWEERRNRIPSCLWR